MYVSRGVNHVAWSMHAVGTVAGVAALIALVVASNVSVGIGYPAFVPSADLSLWDLATAAALCLCVLPLFAFARFSFGYLIGLYLYAVVAGYVFLSFSSRLPYDHSHGRISAILSLIAFLVPALYLRIPALMRPISPGAMNALLSALTIVSVLVLAGCVSYGFRFANILTSSELRNDISRPRLVNYASGIVTGALLPFAFAYFATRGRWLIAIAAALLIAGFFPVLLNKTTLFAPVWLIYLFVLFRLLNPKIAAILAIALPMTVGLGMFWQDYHPYIFGFVNLRMVAIPSVGLDHYFAFFDRHPLTYFCQINVVRVFTGCPYAEQLGVIMERAYHLGNFNASLLASEGIASVGPWLAPIATFVCGTVIAIGSAAASRLSPLLMAVSSGLLVQALLNVPLSTALLSNGGGVLFLLWMVSPSDQNASAEAAAENLADTDIAALRKIWWWRSPDLVDSATLQRLIASGMLTKANGRLALTEAGIERISADGV